MRRSFRLCRQARRLTKKDQRALMLLVDLIVMAFDKLEQEKYRANKQRQADKIGIIINRVRSIEKAANTDQYGENTEDQPICCHF
jgi:hypothetical protein